MPNMRLYSRSIEILAQAMRQGKLLLLSYPNVMKVIHSFRLCTLGKTHHVLDIEV